jgi:hypothetical protein
MEFLKEFFQTLLGSFKLPKGSKNTQTVEEKPLFSNTQLLGVPTSTIENPIKIQKTKKIIFYIAIGVIILSILIALIGFFSVRNGYCIDIEKKVKEKTLEYAKE